MAVRLAWWRDLLKVSSMAVEKDFLMALMMADKKD